MSIYLYIYIYLSICFSSYPSTWEPIGLPIYLSIHPSICLFINLSVDLSIYLSIYRTVLKSKYTWTQAKCRCGEPNGTVFQVDWTNSNWRGCGGITSFTDNLEIWSPIGVVVYGPRVCLDPRSSYRDPWFRELFIDDQIFRPKASPWSGVANRPRDSCVYTLGPDLGYWFEIVSCSFNLGNKCLHTIP